MQLRIDTRLLLVVFILVILGVVFIFSSSYYQAIKKGEDTTYYLVGHLKRLLSGIGFFFLGLFFSYEKLRKFLLPTYLFLFIFLLLTLILGKFAYGAKRSLVISSFGIQISEFVRVFIVFYLANLLSRYPEMANNGRRLFGGILFPVSLVILIALQPSISVALISLITVMIMLIYGNVRMKFLMPVVVTGIVLIVIAFFTLPYIRHRLTSFITNPTYQVQQSLIAIGSGGILGRGPGAGLQKFLFLPRIHNDFIFAHIAEELGFLGSAIIFILYWEIFLRGITIANSIDDDYAKLIVLGLNATIFVIFLIHVGVSLGLLPATGIPLPFVSYGGWSLCANLFSVGQILKISRLR